MELLEQMRGSGLVPNVRLQRSEDALPVGLALCKASLPIFTVSFAQGAACDALRRLHAEMPEAVAGAYGVTGVDQAERAVDAGAALIVTCGFNTDVARYCVEREVPVLPGCATATDVETALAFGLGAGFFYPADAAAGLQTLDMLAAAYPRFRFVAGGAAQDSLPAYLRHPAVLACMSDAITPTDVLESRDFARITALGLAAVQAMLAFSLAHVGVNSGSEEAAFRQAEAFCAVLGWPVRPGNSSVFAGKIVEFVKEPWTGEHGHIAVGVDDIDRAWWHMEKYGVVFDWENAKYKDDKLAALYLREQIGGFAVHLQQR